MDVSEVHKTKAKICSYVLKCAAPADSEKDAYYYVGMSEDLEKRMLQHTGAAEGGAQFTSVYPPTELISVKIHETIEEAYAAECANWNLYAGILKDYDAVRGGRYNSILPLRYPPRGWKPIQENQQ